MKKLMLLILACAGLARGQTSSTGNITAQGTTCATTNACVSLAGLQSSLNFQAGTVAITLAGTFSATLQYEISADGGNTWVNASTQTTAGVTQVNVAGYTNARVRCSTYVSGTVVVTIQASTAGGGSGGGAGVSNPSGKEYWVGTGYTFTTVDALVETLAAGNYIIHDTNCTGTNGVGDDWTVDPFNPTSAVNLRLILYYGPCKFPLASEVPIAIGQSSSLILLGTHGKLGSGINGGVIIAGPSFPGGISGVGPTLGSGAFGSVTTTTGAPCGGFTFASTTTVDIEATFYQLAGTGILGIQGGVNGQTLVGTAQTSLTINSGSCATYTAPAVGNFPTNSVGMSLFASVHAANVWGWEGNVAPGGTITFPTAHGVTNGLNPNPDPPGFNTSGALIYLGKRNENTNPSGNTNFGVTFSGYIDANAKANFCLANVGAEELSGPYNVDCQNPLGTAGLLVEGFNGSVTSNNSKIERFDYNASSCSASNPCGGYPGAGAVTTGQEASVAAIIVDQVNSFRGLENVTVTPNTAGAPTLYNVLLVGTTTPEAANASFGMSIFNFHGEGPSSGSHLKSHIKSCGAQLSGVWLNGNSKTVVDLDDLQSTDCQAAATYSFAGATPFSQPSFGSDVSAVFPAGSGASAVVDHTTGFISTINVLEPHYAVGSTSTSYCDFMTNTCPTWNVPSALTAGGTGTAIAGVFKGDSHGSDIAQFNTNAGGAHSGVWMDASGNLNLAGNTFTLGSASQATQSAFTLYGSASGTNTAPGYIRFFSNNSAQIATLYGPGLTTSGNLCIGSAVPGGDCSPATAQNVIVGFLGGTPPTVGHCPSWSVATSPLQVNDSGITCSAGVVTSATSMNTTTFTASAGMTSNTNTGGVKVQCGIDANSNTSACVLTLRGASLAGGATASTTGGHVLITGGNDASTGTTPVAGGVEIGSGQDTGAASLTGQGLYTQFFSYAKGATSTVWNIQCMSTAMITVDCGASPGNWIGIAEVVGTNAVQVVASGQVAVNSSNSTTVGHTFCAGAASPSGSDSGGTTACALGSQIGIVIANSGTFKFPDGTSVTLSGTLPLIQIARD